jgi:hypothetical protein
VIQHPVIERLQANTNILTIHLDAVLAPVQAVYSSKTMVWAFEGQDLTMRPERWCYLSLAEKTERCEPQNEKDHRGKPRRPRTLAWTERRTLRLKTTLCQFRLANRV